MSLDGQDLVSVRPWGGVGFSGLDGLCRSAEHMLCLAQVSKRCACILHYKGNLHGSGATGKYPTEIFGGDLEGGFYF